MIIVFSGVDCAGKSTQINLLKKQISKQGVTVKSMWSRGGYTPGFQLLKKLMRIVLGKKLIPSGKGERRDKAMSSSLISYLWLMIAMLDLLILYVITIRIESLLGKVVICDRYLGDTFIDFSLNFSKHNFEKMWLWKLLLAVSPKPNIGFLFILPAEESMYRSKLKYEPFPDSKEGLEQRLKIYGTSRFFKDKHWVKIDGLNSIESSASFIKDKVFHALNCVNAS